MLWLTLSPEIHLKSPRTRRRFRRVLYENLRAGLERSAPGARLETSWDAARIVGNDLEAAAEVAARTFGVQRVELAQPLPVDGLEVLARRVAEQAAPRVAGHTFAVRVRRKGEHDWRSVDAERLIGSLLLGESAGVDLTDPEVTVAVRVDRERAYLMDLARQGPDGLPLRSQGKVLALLSGGFDSAVAAWMLMRRGSAVDFLHFSLDCAQSDHALAVAQHVQGAWGHGTRPLAHVVGFEGVEQALREEVEPRLRQVVLKRLMVGVADRLAARYRIPALVTGDSVGQVSSQTLHHLAATDRAASRTVLRPLAGLTKQEIIDWSRRVGTHDLSARAKEVCDLAQGPVAVAARPGELERAHRALPDRLLEEALAGRRVVAVEDWTPGDPLIPVVAEPPQGVPLVRLNGHEGLPEEGPLSLSGRRAPHVASRLHRRGRQVWVVEAPIAA